MIVASRAGLRALPGPLGRRQLEGAEKDGIMSRQLALPSLNHSSEHACCAPPR